MSDVEFDERIDKKIQEFKILINNRFTMNDPNEEVVYTGEYILENFPTLFEAQFGLAVLMEMFMTNLRKQGFTSIK